ncbi:MAG: bifunctional folylpolyglutamate synthase/dihydrofolate synthase [Firmicutes bacterium]|nr:bifunctional folylpolyglutamate synthase/dihydrofolate synthase [Bacillota bacterium]
MTYENALEYIHSINWRGSRPGLSRIRELCRRLDNPQQGLKFIHVAGTNGKGSFCAMLSSVLTASGYKTGLFISPYVTDFTERMSVDGTPVSHDELAEIIEKIRPLADSMDDPPTEFELITATAFEFFAKKKCDIVVLEVGLGGRLDSTNIINPPVLSVITEISLDHTAILGKTIPEIAREKAGIIKYPSPVLFAGSATDALDVIENVSSSLGCELYTPDYSAIKLKETSVTGSVFDFGDLHDVKIPLAGLYQPRNAAAVIEAARILALHGFGITEDSIRRGLFSTVWHARFELLSREPTVIYDGGHNPQGVTAAVESLSALFPDIKVTALSGVMSDKDYKTTVDIASPKIARVFTVKPNNPRSLGADAYADAFAGAGVDSVSCDSIEAGVALAVADAEKNSRPLYIFGSLYMYADVRRALEKALADVRS